MFDKNKNLQGAELDAFLKKAQQELEVIKRQVLFSFTLFFSSFLICLLFRF